MWCPEPDKHWLVRRQEVRELYPLLLANIPHRHGGKKVGGYGICDRQIRACPWVDRGLARPTTGGSNHRYRESQGHKGRTLSSGYGLETRRRQPGIPVRRDSSVSLPAVTPRETRPALCINGRTDTSALLVAFDRRAMDVELAFDVVDSAAAVEADDNSMRPRGAVAVEGGLVAGGSVDAEVELGGVASRLGGEFLESLPALRDRLGSFYRHPAVAVLDDVAQGTVVPDRAEQ